MKETEAQKKLCPTMTSNTDAPITCVGSRCMGWRDMPKVWDVENKKMVKATEPHGCCDMVPPELECSHG